MNLPSAIIHTILFEVIVQKFIKLLNADIPWSIFLFLAVKLSSEVS